jgi:hypothetical protein
MVHNKTGGLFRIAIKLLMACATEHADVCVYVCFGRVAGADADTGTTSRS